MFWDYKEKIQAMVDMSTLILLSMFLFGREPNLIDLYNKINL